MKLLSIMFQYSSVRVFEPLNVYEKCKVFMCSMRCSDSRAELVCMIKCLNEILLNKETKKEMRVILLREHLSYLLKLTAATPNPSSLLQHAQQQEPPHQQEFIQNNSTFLSLTSDDGLGLIKSLLDLLESMVALMSGEDESVKEQETLTIFVHILGMYLTEPASAALQPSSSIEVAKRSHELNEFVIKKIVALGVGYKQELKGILEKWPSLKLKIGTALKSSTSISSSSSSSATGAGISLTTGSATGRFNPVQQPQANKTPKIQLNFNFSKK
jgi:hypothetical protein